MANKTLSVVLLSGKGGVGKTNISLNLACALFQMGFKNLLMDCDLGLANLDVLLGITPEGNLQNALLGEAQIRDVLHHVEPEGFDVLPAASGVPELTELQPDMRDVLLARLEPELNRYDYVFMDVGAGISGTVQTFASMAAMRIVVITPEPTSLTDAYALIKVLKTNHGVERFRVCVNMAPDQKTAKEMFVRLHQACDHFLSGVSLELVGVIPRDTGVRKAVVQQLPYCISEPQSPAAKATMSLAKNISA